MTCTQPGCTGAIADGYCDVCGTPANPTPAPTPSPVPAGLDGAVSTRTSSQRLASAAIGSARTGRTGSTRRVGSSSKRLRASRLGAGLTTIAAAPAVDAVAALLNDPQVAESKRYCPSCSSPVGRSAAGRPGRTEGFCPKCRNPYSFAPKLKAGDLVGGQYEVAGALAHGGLGWIYLARDKNVSDRWVVLKGLLNTGDADAMAAAIAERQFLAQVEHPRIVEIYNFVTHDGSGYTVMEYVGGHSLKELLKERMTSAGEYNPFPLDQALAYVLEILPAFEYLHDLGLVYCDFKPDNLIQVGDDVKLIDMGGVRRIDDEDSAIYGTVGYQAPEVATDGVSVASDIYTLGRTLLVLAMEFRGYQSQYVATLPSVGDTPLFAKYDSFYRLVAKACAPNPDDRFATVAEFRVQLHGVLREVVAQDGDVPAARDAHPSLLFTAPDLTGQLLSDCELPQLRVDVTDSQAMWLAALDTADIEERLGALESNPVRSSEVLLALAKAGLDAGRPEIVLAATNELLAADPWEWRAVWLQGLMHLSQGNDSDAKAAFNAVYGQVPGELAPKLALAVACETSGEPEIAQALYATCARADAAYVPAAAFAIARLRNGAGDVRGAVTALDLIPTSSRSFVASRALRATLLAVPGASLTDLADALACTDGVGLDPDDRNWIVVAALTAALEQVPASSASARTASSAAAVRSTGPHVHVGRWPATSHDLRTGLEGAYRALALTATSPAHKVALVDAANQVRPWTLR